MAGCCEHGNEPASSGQAGEAWEPADSKWQSIHFLQSLSRVTEATTAATAFTAPVQLIPFL